MLQTAAIRAEIPKLISRLNITSVLDAPCGDFHWMSRCDLQGVTYCGVDIVEDLIAQNRDRYASETRRFEVKNIISDPLPQADLVICRDCLVHLSFQQIFEALRNFKASGSRYLLTTTFTNGTENSDLMLSKQFWRRLNLQLPPFSIPSPHCLVVEDCTEADGRYGDKSLGLWDLESLPV
ncbi:MAG: class I SAM-dependent methyltransferase [Pseudomonadota bacterium]